MQAAHVGEALRVLVPHRSLEELDPRERARVTLRTVTLSSSHKPCMMLAAGANNQLHNSGRQQRIRNAYVKTPYLCARGGLDVSNALLFKIANGGSINNEKPPLPAFSSFPLLVGPAQEDHTHCIGVFVCVWSLSETKVQ